MQHNPVTGIGVLGLPKVETERKPQRNFQTDLITLLLEHRGGSTEEGKVLRTGSAASISWRHNGLLGKGSGSGILDARVVLHPPSVRLLGKHFHAFAVGQNGSVSPSQHPRQHTGRTVVLTSARK